MPPKAQTRAKTMGYIRVYRLIFQDMPRCCAWTHVQSWHGPREARKEGRISAQMIAWEMETFYKRSGALNLDSGDGRGVKRSKARWESSAVAWHLPSRYVGLSSLQSLVSFSACQHPVMWCAVQYIYCLSSLTCCSLKCSHRCLIVFTCSFRQLLLAIFNIYIYR